MEVTPNFTEFNRFGREWQSGRYAKLHRNTEEYRQLWQEQLDRCVNGYSVAGWYISGQLYFYVNFGTMNRIDEEKGGKSYGLPEFREIDCHYDRCLMQAKKERKHLVYVTGRRGGKTSRTSSDAVHSTKVMRQKSFVACQDVKKRDNWMKMFQKHMAGLKGTEFFVHADQNTYDRCILGWGQRDPATNVMTTTPWGGEMVGLVIGDDPLAAAGLTATECWIDEGGLIPHLLPFLDFSMPCVQDSGVNFGTMVVVGTAGDMEKGSIGLSILFENPEAYDFLAFEDPDDPQKSTGFFAPSYLGFTELADANGKVDREEGLKRILTRRKKLEKSGDKEKLAREKSQYPITWKEAFTRTSATYFDIVLIQEQLDRLASSAVKPGIRGEMHFRDGQPAFVPDKTLKEVPFPVRPSADNRGCVTIWEHPMTFADLDMGMDFGQVSTQVPPGMYIAGIDPYAVDKTVTSPSVGSCFIYKRLVANANLTHDIIVAEYTGRPDSADDFYEQVRRLLIYYNAKGLHESNVSGCKQYFERTRSLNYLSKTPGIVKEVVAGSQVVNSYGLPMSQKMRHHGVNLIASWMKEPRGEGLCNAHFIYSRGLLEEMANFDLDHNYDRVDAFAITLIKDSDLFRLNLRNQLERRHGRSTWAGMHARMGI